jgi:CRISPR-associated protein Csb2
MVCISLQFTAGRYHATPWGRHVNEGTVEWPPSQWRFLRSLISVWHLKCSDAVSRETLEEIIEALSTPPLFCLPDASTMGTRHYMPGNSQMEGVKRDVTLVLDTAIALDKADKVFLFWENSELSENAEAGLKILLGALFYFGRSESWVRARLENKPPERINCSTDSCSFNGIISDPVAVACSVSGGAFREWREQYLSQIEDIKLTEKKQDEYAKGRDSEGAKLTKKVIEKAIREVPASLLEALEISTADLRKGGWSMPPGFQFITYHRPSSCFDVKPVSNSVIHRNPVVVRFVLSGSVLPLLTDAISVGERIRIAVMSVAGKTANGAVPEVLSGKSIIGEPLKKDHSHAYFLSESCCGNGRISHVTVYAKRGFDRQSLMALLSLRRIWGRSGYDIQVIPSEFGSPDELGGFDVRKGHSPLMAESTSWESITPFYPTRHPKIKGCQKSNLKAISHYYEEQVRRELLQAGYPSPVNVEHLNKRGIEIGGHFTACLKFNAKRHNGEGNKANVFPAVIKIEFSEPVRGPICIGYGAHYGLGLFLPNKQRSSNF